MIRFWSYKREFKRYQKKINKKISKSLKSGQIFFGDELKEFEKKFIKKYKSKYGIAVGSGTDALLIALKSINIKKGDEVITAANTAIPTISAIINSGAIPKLVDIKDDYLIDCSKIEKTITKKTKAIIPVHLYGQACDMDEINRIAKKNKLFVVEDCAQSHGADYKGKKTGSLGDIGCFSFYPTKILGSYGDAGFITTNNEKIFDKMMRIRFLGMERKKMSSGHWNGKYYAIEHGTNSRLDEVHAAILLIKLKYLKKNIIKRQQIAKRYNKELKNTDLILPEVNNKNKHAYYVYVVQHKSRDKILAELVKKNIHLNISYPWPIHIMEPYKKYVRGSRSSLRNTDIFSKKIFSLPMYPDLSLKKQKYTIKILKEILSKLN